MNQYAQEIFAYQMLIILTTVGVIVIGTILPIIITEIKNYFRTRGKDW